MIPSAHGGKVECRLGNGWAYILGFTGFFDFRLVLLFLLCHHLFLILGAQY
jgi:hypothetical protein